VKSRPKEQIECHKCKMVELAGRNQQEDERMRGDVERVCVGEGDMTQVHHTHA
jgi:hypothetical protein